MESNKSRCSVGGAVSPLTGLVDDNDCLSWDNKLYMLSNMLIELYYHCARVANVYYDAEPITPYPFAAITPLRKSMFIEKGYGPGRYPSAEICDRRHIMMLDATPVSRPTKDHATHDGNIQTEFCNCVPETIHVETLKPDMATEVHNAAQVLRKDASRDTEKPILILKSKILMIYCNGNDC